MADLSYDPNATLKITSLGEIDLSYNVGIEDSLSPSALGSNSGFTDHFNSLSAQGGHYFDTINGMSLYTALEIDGSMQERPADGQDGIGKKFTYDASIGVKAAPLNPDAPDNVIIGYIEMNAELSYSQQEWIPPGDYPYEEEILDDNDNVIGTQTVIETYDIGFHDTDYDAPELPSTTAHAYADTNGTYSLSVTREQQIGSVSAGGQDYDVDGMGSIGINNQEGAYFDGRISTGFPFGESSSVSLESGTLITSKEGSSAHANATLSRGLGEDSFFTSAFVSGDVTISTEHDPTAELSIGLERSTFSLKDGSLPITVVGSVDQDGVGDAFIGIANIPLSPR